MDIQTLYNNLVRAKTPYDFFGPLKSKEDLTLQYRAGARIIHPDVAHGKDEYIAKVGCAKLNLLYEQAKKEIEAGIYGVFDPLILYAQQTPLFELDYEGKLYKMYEYLCDGEVADIYRGVADNVLVCLKLAKDPADNSLIEAEYDLLSKVVHHSLPIVRGKVIINDSMAIVMDEIAGEPLSAVMQQYNGMLPDKHVAWMLERLFSVVGYLHSNFVVHGNINPDNIIINKKSHNVGLTGLSFHVADANKPDAKYNIYNLEYSAPEIKTKAKPHPSSDIYSIGKLAVYMLGGIIESNGMPLKVPLETRTFIRTLVEKSATKRPYDAWQLWSDWKELRTKIYGSQTFIEMQ